MRVERRGVQEEEEKGEGTIDVVLLAEALNIGLVVFSSRMQGEGRWIYGLSFCPPPCTPYSCIPNTHRFTFLPTPSTLSLSHVNVFHISFALFRRTKAQGSTTFVYVMRLSLSGGRHPSTTFAMLSASLTDTISHAVGQMIDSEAPLSKKPRLGQRCQLKAVTNRQLSVCGK